MVQAILPIGALFHRRLRDWIAVRNEQQESGPPADQRVIWMHCSSLGEFEQGRPVWEGLKTAYPDTWFLLTFFSRSGYDRQKNNATSDRVLCLPLDTPRHARQWLDKYHPDLILWVKYDFWFNYWTEAHRRQIPVVLFAARFRPDQFLARPWARGFRQVILTAHTIAVQDEASLTLLRSWGYVNPLHAGDTRIDRVLEIAATPARDTWIEAFTAERKTIVCGSVWDEDLDVLLPAMQSALTTGWCWILAPHELGEDRMQRIVEQCALPAVRYTRIEKTNPRDAQVIILDTMGMLNQVYRWGAITYIGGGFGRSVHNLLEPAAYALPVLFGPNHYKFPEATGLIHAGGGFEVKTTNEFLEVFRILGQDDRLRVAGVASRNWLERHAGATATMLAECKRILGE